MKGIMNPFESLHDTVVFDSKDWGKYEKDAWLYGIIVGWGEEDEERESIFKEFSERLGWSRETWDRLQLLHKEFLKYKEVSERKEGGGQA